MESFFSSLSSFSPTAAVLVEWLLFLIAAILLWIVASIPAAIFYVALRSGLTKAAKYFLTLCQQFFGTAHSIWSAALDLRRAAIEKLTLRYVYDKSENDLIAVLQDIRRSTSSMGDRIDGATNALTSQLAPLQRELQIVADTTRPSSSAIVIPELEELQSSSQLRRTALLMLLVFSPLVLALVTVNTSLLTKFFESFFEEYISYHWGIKWATMVAFMFSLLELALGVGMYYLGRSTAGRNNIMGALAKTVVILMVIALACIESYLYLLLSSDIARQTKDFAGLSGFGNVHQWWLAPFGFVIVIGLSFLGHALVDGLNQFIESGHLQDLKASLVEYQRSLARMDSIWDSLQTKTEGAKRSLTNFAADLAGSSAPISVLSSTKEVTGKLVTTVQSLVSARREPVAQVSNAEADSIFDTHIFLLAIFLVTLVVFCWLQVHFLSFIPAFKHVSWLVYLAIGLLEAGAVMAAGYKAYPSVTTVVEGAVGDVLRSSREKLVNIGCLTIVISAVFLNLFITRQETYIMWAAMFAVALIAIGVLAILGRTLALLTFVASTLVKIAGTSLVSLLVWTAAVVTWIVSLLVRVTTYALYLSAYPTLFLFWRSQLSEPSPAGSL